MLRSCAAIALSACVLAACGEDTLPEIQRVPSFTLESHLGSPVSSRDLDGHVWVASFVFTSCRDVCPLITNSLANLHRRVSHPDVRFVSFSVDPEVDTPAVLAGYAERYGADERWVFLTGEPAVVRRTLADGFHVPVGERTRDEDGTQIAHSERLLLVDRDGVVRGQYDTDRAGLDRLVRDIDSLRRAH